MTRKYFFPSKTDHYSGKKCTFAPKEHPVKTTKDERQERNTALVETLQAYCRTQVWSVARGEQTETSDVDVCYEGQVPSLLTLDRIQTELEAILGCPVNLVRVRDGMNSLLKQRIKKEGIYV